MNRFAPLTADGRFAQLAFHRRGQAAQVALHQVIVRAGFHRGHGGGFADAPGDDEEREIQPGLLEKKERVRRAESRQIVVRKNHVPGLCLQRRLVGFDGFNPFAGDVVAALANETDHHLRVEL